MQLRKEIDVKLNYEQYKERAARLASRNSDPSETDQTGADDTNINVIVKRYGVYGTVPSGLKSPLYGQDTTEWPTDLSEAIEIARSLNTLRQKLPEQMRNLNEQELLALTPEEIVDILKPSEKPAEDKKVEQA